MAFGLYRILVVVAASGLGLDLPTKELFDSPGLKFDSPGLKNDAAQG